MVCLLNREIAAPTRWRLPSCSPVASGDRGEEAQQRNEPLAVAAAKALDQRDRQAIVIDGRHECGPADLPERARREGVAPPFSPALDRPAVDADQLGQLRIRAAVAPSRMIAIRTTIAAR